MEKIIKDLTDLWVELKERREIVIKHSKITEFPIAKQIYIVMANEHATIMDALAKIIKDGSKKSNTPVPGNPT